MRLEIKRKGSASQYYYNCFFAGSGSPWILALLPHRSKKPGKLGFDVFFFFTIIVFILLFRGLQTSTPFSLRECFTMRMVRYITKCNAKHGKMRMVRQAENYLH